MAVTVKESVPGSPAAKRGVVGGDTILRINGHEIMDVLDYRFYQDEKRLKLDIECADGRLKSVTVHKGEYEELGLEFESYLMDEQHACRNGCIFCFIDQLPKGMRPTLYFKDDDSRLSFLFGNYITLTNLSEHEIARIIDMHISPVNISVHTTDPALRCKMMRNRFAGESLGILDRFNKAGIRMNCQLVLVPGYNDGAALERTLRDLTALEQVQSVAAVPVGLTKYREGLTPLTPFDAAGARAVVRTMEDFGAICLQTYGERRVFASDEFYLTAGLPIPEASFYEDFAQLDNGVGTWALLKDEAMTALQTADAPLKPEPLTIITGRLAAPLMEQIVAAVKTKFPEVDCEVLAIRNDFFGENITVAGLVTGGDLIAQAEGRVRGTVLIPACMLRYENDLFLDDVSLDEVKRALACAIERMPNDGSVLVERLLGRKDEENCG